MRARFSSQRCNGRMHYDPNSMSGQKPGFVGDGSQSYLVHEFPVPGSVQSSEVRRTRA